MDSIDLMDASTSGILVLRMPTSGILKVPMLYLPCCNLPDQCVML